MKAVVFDQPGGPEVLRLADVDDPPLRDSDVLIQVAAAGVNRADLLQRMGFYPAPPGASDILGLEIAGEVAAVGNSVETVGVGDSVMSLVEGGGYAELCAAPAAQTMRVPPDMDVVQAGGVPEAFITAHDNLFTRGRLEAGEWVLIHGGAGGVGTAAVQLARYAGARVIATAGSEAKLNRSRELGAEHAINHTTEDFVAVVRDVTDGHGANVILDVMGAAYLERNVNVLATDGRLVIIGLQGGTQAELDLAVLSRKRATIIATTLRARPAAQKAAIVKAFRQEVLPALQDGSLKPVVDRVYPLHAAAEAHRALQAGDVIGKIVLSTEATQ